MEKEKQLLALCRELIERSLNWGESSTWGNDDFEKLSEKIFDKTRVRLSVSTLKRIWGRVRYENFPATGTLNALASFIGFENWRDFRQKNIAHAQETLPENLNVNVNKETPLLKKTIPMESKAPASRTALIFLLFIGLLSVLPAAYFIKNQSLKTFDSSKIKFEANKVSDNLPNSVVFNYDASAFK